MVVKVDRSKAFDPAFVFGSGWTIWKGPPTSNGLEGEEQQDARSLALSVVDFVKAARFETCTPQNERVITGEERLGILTERKDVILADAAFGPALMNEAGRVTLNWVYATSRIPSFGLPGTVLRRWDGLRFFLVLCRHDVGGWYPDIRYLSHGYLYEPPDLLFAGEA